MNAGAANSPGIQVNKRMAAGRQPAERTNMSEKLSISTGIKKIEVNDAGECITVNMSDNTFFSRLRGFMDAQKSKEAEVRTWEDELKTKYPDYSDPDAVVDENKTKMVFDILAKQKEVCDWECRELDKLFGEGCMRKVFPGVESPGMDLIGDFLEAVIPILQKFANERNEKINLRYGRNRKGARSK